ncbi:hypothetical protein A1O1_00183 [Capronia coronata CBS 617.96]|uniref:Exosome complex protein n=1 Tax=Capronia coronata CBS 617.96 TaxID=1182541 RepID=W9YZE9_9EURO|nr:uncharacterized protein A1O1_00183 [Capronia coronata CBS 617.96]EXJ95065.1 hypothetical protein A1O1_00183 [Capronia coronata CBS 617.96]
MDTKSLLALVEQLEDNIDDLEDNLQPLTEGALATTTKKLPVLDRAKLNVLLVYSIESLLFSYLKLHGVQAKDHAVFRELTRVKQYFEKIKEVENGPSAQPSLTLNKEAAGRIIKHALAGNNKYDLERAEREARERVLANKKLRSLEASMKEKAKAQETNDALETNAALQQAAELASIQQATPAESSPSSSENDSEEEGAVLESDQSTSSANIPVTVAPPKPIANSKSGSKPGNASSHKSHDKFPPSEPKQGKKRKSNPTQEEQEAKKQKKQEKKAKKAQNKANKKAKAKAKNASAAG